jgi:hypothetical protein
MRVVGSEARIQFDPFQWKYGTAAATPPIIWCQPFPVTVLQTAFAFAIRKRTSNPFSLSP